MNHAAIEKRLSIINAVLNTALTIEPALQAVGKYAGKKPRYLNKRLYSHKARKDRKRHIACLIAQAAITATIGAARIHMIASQPTPKFRPGSKITINEIGNEEIIYPNSKASK